MRRFRVAMGFLTVLPLPALSQHRSEDLAQSVTFFPVVGLLIGLSAACIAALLDGVFPAFVLSVLLVGWLAGVHGGLHLDGLGDTADGFFSPYGRDRVLAIMRDSHIGAFGCMAIGGILALKVAAIASLTGDHRLGAVLLAPLAGRCIMAPMLGFLPSARPEGLGQLFCRHRSAWESVWTTAVLIGAAWLTARLAGLIAGVAVMTATVSFAFVCKRRIGGATGDAVGASSEIAEAVVLLALSAQPMSGLWR